MFEQHSPIIQTSIEMNDKIYFFQIWMVILLETSDTVSDVENE